MTEQPKKPDYKKNALGHFGKGNSGGPGTIPRSRVKTYRDKLPGLLKRIIDSLYDDKVDSDKWLAKIKEEEPAKYLTFLNQLLRSAESHKLGQEELEGTYGIESGIRNMSDDELDAFILKAAENIKGAHPDEYASVSMTEAKANVKKQGRLIDAMKEQIEKLKKLAKAGGGVNVVASATVVKPLPSAESARNQSIARRQQELYDTNQRRMIDIEPEDDVDGIWQ